MAKIRVLSLDYDGCLARKGFMNNIVEHNQELVSEFLRTNNDHSKTIAFIGSNRQSKGDNDRNASSNHNGSCYEYIPPFCEAIGAEFNPFLLADLYNDAPHGTVFNEALHETDNEFKHKGWLHDASKISIIYAQMQKIASENPDDEIDFEFYDDKQEILDGLYHFFDTNKNLIPEKVKLKLHRYAGEMPLVCRSIQGEGNYVNNNYAPTIKNLGNAVLAYFTSQHNLYDVDGNEASLETIQQQQYNSGCQFSVIPKPSADHNFGTALIKAHAAVDPELLLVKSKIAEVVNAYTSYTRENCWLSIFHRHGETGRIRANNFLAEITDIDDYNILQGKMNDFIEDNRNGNTNPHSFRTMLFYKFKQEEVLEAGETLTLMKAAELLTNGLGQLTQLN